MTGTGYSDREADGGAPGVDGCLCHPATDPPRRRRGVRGQTFREAGRGASSRRTPREPASGTGGRVVATPTTPARAPLEMTSGQCPIDDPAKKKNQASKASPASTTAPTRILSSARRLI